MKSDQQLLSVLPQAQLRQSDSILSLKSRLKPPPGFSSQHSSKNEPAVCGFLERNTLERLPSHSQSSADGTSMRPRTQEQPMIVISALGRQIQGDCWDFLVSLNRPRLKRFTIPTTVLASPITAHCLLPLQTGLLSWRLPAALVAKAEHSQIGLPSSVCTCVFMGVKSTHTCIHERVCTQRSSKTSTICYSKVPQ